MRYLASLLLSIIFFSTSICHATTIDFNTVSELPYSVDLETITSKIKPTIIYARLKSDECGFKKDEIVEVLEDVANGKHYKVRNNTLCTWVHGYNLEFLDSSSDTPLLPLYPIELETYMNASNHSSDTNYFVWVDLARQNIYIFQGSQSKWHLTKLLLCASGKSTTSTIRGYFKIQDRGEMLRSKETAKYWVRFHDNYLFHSCPLDNQGEVIDPRLGEPISNGCIRMHIEDAKWFFETIPTNTTVWIY